MKDIKYLPNGFEVTWSSGKRLFVAYQSISQIGDVYVDISDENYDWLSRSYVGENIIKYCYFDVKIIGKDWSLQIVLDDNNAYFPRNSKKAIGFWENFCRQFQEYGISKEASDWIEDKENGMKEQIEKLKIVRNQMIENFNKWRNNNE